MKFPIKHRGYSIVPKKDFGDTGFFIGGKFVKKGFIVTDGFCNVMPGATWFQTIVEARQGINIFVEVKGNANKFWEIMKPFEYTHVGQKADFENGIVTQGRFKAVIENFKVVKLTS